MKPLIFIGFPGLAFCPQPFAGYACDGCRTVYTSKESVIKNIESARGHLWFTSTSYSSTDISRNMSEGVTWETTDPAKLTDFVATSTKKKSLDDLGSRVLERLRAKRRKYKKNVNAKNEEKEHIKKLQTMQKVRGSGSSIERSIRD